MQYKTIVLSLLEERPALYGRLRRQRTLLTTLERYSADLKRRHETWKAELSRTRPGGEEGQLASEALEIALREFEDHLPPESSTDAAVS